MPDTIESSRATPDALLRQSLRLGTVATAGPKPLKCKWDFEFPRRAHERRGTLRKSRGLLTHRPGRCNIAKLPTRSPDLRLWLLQAVQRLQPQATGSDERHALRSLGRVDQHLAQSAQYVPTREGGYPCAHCAC